MEASAGNASAGDSAATDTIAPPTTPAEMTPEEKHGIPADGYATQDLLVRMERDLAAKGG